MPLLQSRVRALRRNVSPDHVRTRESRGKELTYIEGWWAISEANRIFGFDGWDRETIEAKCLLSRETREGYYTLYIAKVRVTVHVDDAVVIREGHGTGEVRAGSAGEAHDFALKAAETDATKRALATFGRRFGLALYGSGGEARRVSGVASNGAANTTDPWPPPAVSGALPPPAKNSKEAKGRPGETGEPVLAKPSVATAGPATATQTHLPRRIDKSAFALSEPKRQRDKEHLIFVASQPCLLCGKHPTEAHHLRFAQPRALGRKVSDEFTVPLCPDHHRELHLDGNEPAWWHAMGIDPLPIAEELWQDTLDARPRAAEVESSPAE